MLPEEKDDEILRSNESRPKRENTGAGIDRLVMSFDRKTYKSRETVMREQCSKDETDSFIKVSANVMFTQMSAKAGINKYGDNAVASMVK